MYIKQCDKCGRQSEPQKQTYQIKDVFDISVQDGRVYNSRIVYHVCISCASKIGIPTDAKERDKDIGERLLDILTEITQEAISE